MKERIKRVFSAVTALSLVTIGLMLTGCGSGGGGLSSEVVSGTAAVGAPLSGKVSLKDSSSTPQVRSTVINSDGTFAIDVTGMKSPFILQAAGSAEGKEYKLHSVAQGTGTANINPLSDVIVASAAEVDDASEAYEKHDSNKRHKIENNLSRVVDIILNKLQPLLERYNAHHKNPITSRFIANHLDLDEMFDNVKITVTQGTLSIIYGKTGAVIYTGKISDIANGNFYPGNVPPASAIPAAPAGLSATGGAGQVTLAWSAVSNATSYNVYYATATGVTTANGTKIPASTNSYVQTGLPAGTTYYYVVTALNSTGESVASSQVSAATNPAAPVPTVPTAPAGVSAVGGTQQATISWSAVSGATSYNIYWSKTSGVTTANGTKISNATSPAVQIGLSDSTTYYYIVTAVNGVGEGAASVQVAATTLAPVPAPTAPAAPTGVSAAGGANQVTISWSAVSGATFYNLYRATAAGVTTANGTKISGVTSPYVNTGLSAGTSYYYIVTAVNSVGESIASTQVSATTNPELVLDGAVLYSSSCQACHGALATSSKQGRTSSQIQSAINANIGGMGSLSTLTAAQVQAIATALVAPPAPVLDGAALYAQYCNGCHGTSKLGKSASAIQGAITANIGGMGSLSTLTSAQVAAIATTTAPTPPPAPACGSCHAIPPALGEHAKHDFTSCATCHGTGYSSTTVNAATHANGVKNVGGSSGWNATSRSCSNSCHGSRSW